MLPCCWIIASGLVPGFRYSSGIVDENLVHRVPVWFFVRDYFFTHLEFRVYQIHTGFNLIASILPFWYVFGTFSLTVRPVRAIRPEASRAANCRRRMIGRCSFGYLETGREIIRPAVSMYIPFPLWLRNAENLFHENGSDICHETVRFRWHRFGPLLAA